MEKYYMLRINNDSYYFKKLNSVKEFISNNSEEEINYLIDDEGEEYSLDKLEDILGLGLRIVNMVYDRGDDYCDFYLEIITFED